MRSVVLGLVGSLFTTLVACSGEVAPADGDKTTSKQQVEPPVTDESPDFVNQPQTTTPAPAEPGYGYEACWNAGAPAEGECTVGTLAYCDGYQQSSVFQIGTYCQHLCVNDNGKAVWSDKAAKNCEMFSSKYHVDKPGCSCDDFLGTEHISGNTPLVLSFDDAPVTFNTTAGSAFDLVADGQCHGSDWPSAATPWLALDRDGNGSIDDGSELFGSAVRLADGTRAHNGFEALRELDANHDGVFDANDEAFARVVVWTDRNGDRTSSANELTSLADAGVRSISLADRMEKRCDARGNCEGERSLFTTTAGRRGTVIDVYLKQR